MPGGRGGTSRTLEGVEPLTRAEVKEIAEQTLAECIRRVFADLPVPDELEQRRRLAETVLVMQKDGGDFPTKPLLYIARCPDHGLHGERNECFECGGPVEQIGMVPIVLVKPIGELDVPDVEEGAEW